MDFYLNKSIWIQNIESEYVPLPPWLGHDTLISGSEIFFRYFWCEKRSKQRIKQGKSGRLQSAKH